MYIQVHRCIHDVLSAAPTYFHGKFGFLPQRPDLFEFMIFHSPETDDG